MLECYRAELSTLSPFPAQIQAQESSSTATVPETKHSRKSITSKTNGYEELGDVQSHSSHYICSCYPRAGRWDVQSTRVGQWDVQSKAIHPIASAAAQGPAGGSGSHQAAGFRRSSFPCECVGLH